MLDYFFNTCWPSLPVVEGNDAQFEDMTSIFIERGLVDSANSYSKNNALQ